MSGGWADHALPTSVARTLLYHPRSQGYNIGTYVVSDSAFCTRFSRLEVPEQALDGIPLAT